MKSLLIFGAGGHGSEVLWLVNNINKLNRATVYWVLR